MTPEPTLESAPTAPPGGGQRQARGPQRGRQPGEARRFGAEWGVLAGIAVVTLLLGFTAIAFRPSGVSAPDVRRSALRTTPDGVAALHRAIARLGPPTSTRVTPLVDADPLRGTLVLLQPVRRPSPREVHELLDWVRGGGFLIHAPREDSPILDSLGLVRRTLVEDGDSAGARRDAAREGEQQTDASDEVPDADPAPAVAREQVTPVRELGDGPLWNAHALTEDLPPPAPARYAIAPDTASADEEEEDAQNTQNTQNAEDGTGNEEPAPVPVADYPLLLTAPDSAGHRWTAAALIPLGEGRIVALADAAPLSNRFADEAPLAVLAVRAAIAWTSPGDSVFFDEFSQGLGASRSPARATMGFLVGTPAGRASLHLGLVVLLAFFCAGLRFGTPLAPAGDARRSALEHVRALAAVYENARACETAAVLMLGRLARASRVPPPRDMPEAERLLARLENRTARPGPLPLIRRGLEANPVDLIRVARGIDEHIQGRRSA